ncbi:hypothetical protein A2767_05780 [Candidatus Roizmanbacteria bacterium RIFCSPHIGHO2_01_FULL_35_10]|uniref:Methyltransferase type 11 domain-containing protein n=1 Tax=Candidatus Roizmanbacteria bacterium RIFCSPLOWO2_01_FULL_35_13 TaxID=1802055 RepID=A0A1F7I6V1_9BACT|nr:MAG: hypothetical protein A2767_05780 [Candidatus Roizmanbacteria bacterium RIFCSPHIGHO2_01_FULL_35_10]OGK39098.1 MAG: hypothetical protein A3A74_05740 [Candidatus Roizmanbacteria bacterium RIFCSPLOWO2_01_FULL_35_13]
MPDKNVETDKCSKAIYSFISAYAKTIKNKSIMDVGCGTGLYTSIFNINKNKIFGLDIDDHRKKEYQANFIFKKYGGNKIPFRSNYFDFVVSFDVLEHVEDDVNFIKEINRVIKKGGQCLITTPNRYRLSNFIKILIGQAPKYPLLLADEGHLGKQVHIREYTKSDLKNLFQNIKVNNLRIKPFWFGLRGNLNTGLEKPFIPFLSQYWFISYNKK